MNLVDVAVFMFVGLYSYRGYRRGLFREGLDFMGFILGVGLGVRFYHGPSALLAGLGIPGDWADIVGGSMIFLGYVAGCAVLSNRFHAEHSLTDLQPPIRFGGSLVAAAWSGLFAAILLAILTAIPSPLAAQRAITESAIGRSMLRADSPVYAALDDYARNEARNVLFYLRQYFAQLEPAPQGHDADEFFTIQPSDRIEIDEAAEKEILDLVNQERRKRGLKPLVAHDRIRGVARGHSSDMYMRGYFAHTNPDGTDPFERIAAGGVHYSYAGENLALAPTVTMVHQGLMNSPPHKENILKKEFTDLGIGVYKGPYGLMVTQNFCAGCRN